MANKKIQAPRLPPKKDGPDLSSVKRGEKGRLLPGSTANPNGRPPIKYGSWAEMINTLMEEEGIDGTTDKERILRKVKELALCGVPWAIEFCADRTDGKPSTSVDVTSKGESLKKGVDLSAIPLPVLLEYLKSQEKEKGK